MPFLSRLSQWLVETLEPFGALGLMIIAICDSSFISLPEVNDAALMALSIANPSRMWLLASMTTVGSVIGCSLLYSVGRKGGEALLRKRFAEGRLNRVRGWYQKYGMLAIIVPSLLPPPLPFKIFVLSAGAFRISWFKFLAAVAIGRSIRYFSEGILAVMYGRQAIQIVTDYFGIIGIALGSLIVSAVFFYVLWKRRKRATAYVVPLFLLAAFSAGCVRTRTIPESERMLDSYPLTRDQALQKLQQFGKAVQSIQASITLDASAPHPEEKFKRKDYPQLTGQLRAARNPDRIRLSARLQIPTAFVMTSDGERYEFWIPQRNELYEGEEEGPPVRPLPHLGDVGNSMINIKPSQFHEAVLWDVTELIDDPQIRAAAEIQAVPQDRRRYYIVNFVDISRPGEARVVQKIWFDLSTSELDVVRRQVLGEGGEIETDVRYSEHVQVGSVRVPAVVRIDFPRQEKMVRMTLDAQRIALNADIPGNVFEPEPHPGADVYKLEPAESASALR